MSAPIPCSVQVLVRNVGPTIDACLGSLRDFAEVIVQDGRSADGTREAAAHYQNVTIMDQNPAFLDANGRIVDFAAMRNESIRAATHDWVFVIDGDEAVTPAQVAEVRAIVEKNRPGVFVAFRRFVVGGVPVAWSAVYPALQIRLFHRSLTEGYVKPIHERLKLRVGVSTEMLQEELPVPLPPAEALRAKYRRYLLMEAKRASAIGFGGWTYWVLFRNTRSVAGMLARLAWIWLVPRRGKRLPLAYEGQFVAHSLKTIVYTFPPFRRFVPAP
jgi:glycosyltransferase involved in cell wall biosynthesis